MMAMNRGVGAEETDTDVTAAVAKAVEIQVVRDFQVLD